MPFTGLLFHSRIFFLCKKTPVTAKKTKPKGKKKPGSHPLASISVQAWSAVFLKEDSQHSLRAAGTKISVSLSKKKQKNGGKFFFLSQVFFPPPSLLRNVVGEQQNASTRHVNKSDLIIYEWVPVGFILFPSLICMTGKLRKCAVFGYVKVQICIWFCQLSGSSMQLWNDTIFPEGPLCYKVVHNQYQGPISTTCCYLRILLASP